MFTTSRSLHCLPPTERIWVSFIRLWGTCAHLPVVEVDIETGKVKFLAYVAVHDCGTLVNPMTLAGHVRGGTAQGIGTALYERYHYDPEGQLLTASFMDYLIPTLHELPEDIIVGHIETPSPFTEYGHQGRRRGWPHGCTAGGRKRRRGCAETTGRADRHPAADSQASQEPDPPGAGAPFGCSGVTVRCE